MDVTENETCTLRAESHHIPLVFENVGNNQTFVLEVPTVYAFCSKNSNSMKLSNPHSGIYEADTSRTLDENGGNPACNQGGMIVLEGSGTPTFASWKWLQRERYNVQLEYRRNAWCGLRN